MRVYAPFLMPNTFYRYEQDYYPGTDNIQFSGMVEITSDFLIRKARIEKIREWLGEEKRYFYKDEKLAAKNARVGHHNCIIELEVNFKGPAIFNKNGAIIVNDKCDFRYRSKASVPELFDIDVERAKSGNKAKNIFAYKNWLMPLMSLGIYALGLLLFGFGMSRVEILSPLMEVTKIFATIIGGMTAAISSLAFLISSNRVETTLNGVVNRWITKDHHKKYEAALGIEQKNVTELTSQLRKREPHKTEALIKKLSDIQNKAENAVFCTYGGLDEKQPVRNKLQVTRWITKRLKGVLATDGIERAQLIQDTLNNADQKLRLLSKKRKI